VPWFVTRHEPLGALLALPCAALLVWLVWREMDRAHWARAAVLGVVAAIPLYTSIMQFTFPRIEALWIAPRLEAVLAREAPGLARRAIRHHQPCRALHPVPYRRRAAPAAPGRGCSALPGGGQPAAWWPWATARMDDFRREAAAQGLTPREIGEVAGFNYTRGRHITLSLFKVSRTHDGSRHLLGRRRRLSGRLRADVPGEFVSAHPLGTHHALRRLRRRAG
jgi:hypothetical protein